MGIANSFKGFETIFAGLRMFWQMLSKLFIVFLVVHTIIVSIYIYFNHDEMYGKIDSYVICLIKTYSIAKITYELNPFKQNFTVDYNCENEPLQIDYNYLISRFEPYVLNKLNIIKSKTIKIVLWTSFIYLILPVLLIYFSDKHKKDTRDEFIRGSKLISPDKLEKDIMKKSGNEFMFRVTDRINIPLGIINRHCITLGKPGSGKTQLISRIIDQLIKNGFRAIIHDFKGDFISTFYDFRKHYIFNPLDKRHMGLKDYEMELIENASDLKVSDINVETINKYAKYVGKASKNDKIINLFDYSFLLDNIRDIINGIDSNSKQIKLKGMVLKTDQLIKGWSIFNELRSSIDIDAFCASLIPESASQDNFWPISSRQLLGSIITYCIHNNKTSYSDLWKLVNLGNEELLKLFQNTVGCEEGTKLLTEAKTANNIMAVMSNYTKPIKYLIGTEGNFSIKDWVKNDKDSRKIIFLSNYAMIQETIKPFLTMFADFSIKTLLSLDDDHNRRLFFILDEFGELGKIGTIVPLLTGSRSKGGCGFLLIQDTARINSIYGQDGCSTIVNACGNLISFAVKKEEAEFVSSCFGTAEIKRTEESKSMGVDNISDSISISKQTVETPIVMSSEVTTIPSLNFYIHLTDFDVSRDKLDIVSFDKKSQSYIGREDLLFNSSHSSASKIEISPLTKPIDNSLDNLKIEEDPIFSEIKSDSSTDENIKKDQSYYGELLPAEEVNLKTDGSDDELSSIKEQESDNFSEDSNQVTEKSKFNDESDGMLF